MIAKRRAFTLIELLVVISLVVLLIAILLPGLEQARFRAKVTVCLMNVHQQMTAQRAYLSDNRGRFPAHRDYAPYTVSNYQDMAYRDAATGFNTRPSWHYALQNYFSNTQVLTCPELARLGGRFRATTRWSVADTNYGGWDANRAPNNTTGKHAWWVDISYDWFANFRDYADVVPTFQPGVVPWPLRSSLQADPRAPMVGHQYWEAVGSFVQDTGHRGNGSMAPGTTLNQAGTTELPMGFFDGSARNIRKSEFAYRALWHYGTFRAYY